MILQVIVENSIVSAMKESQRGAMTEYRKGTQRTSKVRIGGVTQLLSRDIF